jgi:hypothetical protein
MNGYYTPHRYIPNLHSEINDFQTESCIFWKPDITLTSTGTNQISIAKPKEEGIKYKITLRGVSNTGTIISEESFFE